MPPHRAGRRHRLAGPGEVPVLVRHALLTALAPPVRARGWRCALEAPRNAAGRGQAAWRVEIWRVLKRGRAQPAQPVGARRRRAHHILAWALAGQCRTNRYSRRNVRRGGPGWRSVQRQAEGRRAHKVTVATVIAGQVMQVITNRRTNTGSRSGYGGGREGGGQLVQFELVCDLSQL